MKSLRDNLDAIIVCIFEILVGVLLLIDPSGFASFIFIVIGAALILFGVISVIQYFRTQPEEAARGQMLSMGLILLLGGIICVLKYKGFLSALSALPMLYGTAILLTGLVKFQWLVDMLRLRKKKWYLYGISALVSIIIAVLVLKNPFASIKVLWTFTGVGLIAEAVLDLILMMIAVLNKKEA